MNPEEPKGIPEEITVLPGVTVDSIADPSKKKDMGEVARKELLRQTLGSPEYRKCRANMLLKRVYKARTQSKVARKSRQKNRH